ncbi:hypothetical protein CLOBOL_04206 [Enterocloster bolteae ATCC BAA-613]|uniref:Uncharacterized protein n=1 Tax=Enterocloster bolteae (strain ATCC BAA-613 / DSM 15670 / CCUG 46953 / JCM 12243 / WAL 16351) TaxID=411902 RepID=A8RV41_ENTBW|nr:hypothetical protein CLOBOL_04206 [Enterocloster bolteae ATCC BAA-613]
MLDILFIRRTMVISDYFFIAAKKSSFLDFARINQATVQIKNQI